MQTAIHQLEIPDVTEIEPMYGARRKVESANNGIGYFYQLSQ